MLPPIRTTRSNRRRADAQHVLSIPTRSTRPITTRRELTQDSIAFLEDWYWRNPKRNRVEKREIAAQLGLTQKQVTTWFNEKQDMDMSEDATHAAPSICREISPRNLATSHSTAMEHHAHARAHSNIRAPLTERNENSSAGVPLKSRTRRSSANPPLKMHYSQVRVDPEIPPAHIHKSAQGQSSDSKQHTGSGGNTKAPDWPQKQCLELNYATEKGNDHEGNTSAQAYPREPSFADLELLAFVAHSQDSPLMRQPAAGGLTSDLISGTFSLLFLRRSSCLSERAGS